VHAGKRSRGWYEAGYLAADGGVGALDGAHDAEEVIGAGPASGSRGALVRGVGDGCRGEAVGEAVHWLPVLGLGETCELGAPQGSGMRRGRDRGDSCRVGAPL
jgi:hypothetical protein